ncbi:MAG: cobaltochelatase subunit CobN [Dissulfurimicrobium sp.]|uniref:cobaltochelatase subunit CobN n=1 Tax=Dissulfurimicrobium sp. TaxID=2022436 RepID=UPI00404A880A
MGNLTLALQPVSEFSDDPRKLYHNVYRWHQNIYSYIVDDMGEGIQTKHRGCVHNNIIDYAVPLFRQGGLYAGYPRLGSLIS